MSSSGPSPYPVTDQEGLSRKRKQQQNEFVSHVDLQYNHHDTSNPSHFDNVFHQNDLQWQMMNPSMAQQDQQGFGMDPMFAFHTHNAQEMNFTPEHTQGFPTDPIRQHGPPHDPSFQNLPPHPDSSHPTDANAFASNMFHLSPSHHLRRHSVAVGEVMHHQPEQVSPYMDMNNPDMNFDRFRSRHMSTQGIPYDMSQSYMPYQPQSSLFIDTDHPQTLPTPPHTANPIQRRQSKSATTMTKSNARNTQRNRAMSLRLDTSAFDSPMHSGSMQQSSPLTPAFFSPAFLEALNADTQSNPDEGDVYPFPVHPGNQSESGPDAQFVDPSKTMNSARTNSENTSSNFYSSNVDQANTNTASDMNPSPSSSFIMEQKPFLAQQHTTPTIMEENEELFRHLADYGTNMHMPAAQMPINGLGIRHQNDHYAMQEAQIMYKSPSGGATDMRSAIGNFLSSASSLAAGEYTMMLLTSKVAQKSYGTEKRFLCPPPTTIILGPHWWTVGQDDSETKSTHTLHPPKLAIHMSGDATAMNNAQPVQLNTFEWSTATGERIDAPSNDRSTTNGHKASSSSSNAMVTATREPILSGRCVSKNLYINDADEKRKRVEVMVKVHLANGCDLGTFASKGIKVISKPSKKRQNAKNMDLCIHHGSTISLFNRIRSQTVSTKYLGVSTSNDSAIRYGGNVPLDWPGPGAPNDQQNANDSTCFSVRTSSWDPFVIWIVDTSGKQNEQDNQGSENSSGASPRRPTPPIIAMRVTPDDPVAIHYNQPVVLQCLHTGLVSPVMIIRKVDKGSSVLGGARMDRNTQQSDSLKTGGEYGDEALGDPVSQLHKVAFQIVNDPSTTLGHHSNFSSQQTFNEADYLPRLTEPITYLNCANDVVGMHHVNEPRKLNPDLKAELTNRANASRMSMDNEPVQEEWDWSALNNEAFYANPGLMNPADSAIVAHEGGRVVRKRRVSCDMSSNEMPMYRGVDQQQMFAGPGTPQGSTSSPSPVANALATAASSRRRVNSLNDVTLSNESQPRSIKKEIAQARRGSVTNQANSGAGDRAFWTEDVSDAAIWTIVGTDSVMYSFWSPSEQIGNLFSGFNSSSAPVTPVPIVSHYINDSIGGDNNLIIKSNHSSVSPSPMLTSEDSTPIMTSASPLKRSLTIYGQNFVRDLTVWFGNVPSPNTEFKTSEILGCALPDPSIWFNNDGDTFVVQQETLKVPILLVRGDGVVYRTRQWLDLGSTVKIQNMHQGSNAGDPSRTNVSL
ncbi:hypothetical protein INT43_005758 [Umbelopsis isabellina]|uniref:LAG1-DNAbind-domain-containing protein n=1 Tax=Mortierella isabellina TaxID=91625 RepID=A0A8H7PJ52_MORIS|nr:hypothetical protein INT43_005758 [Umbelopsis isabellina]